MSLKNVIVFLSISFMFIVKLHADALPATVGVSYTDSSTWTYSVYNSEPLGDSTFIDSFDLTITAPIAGVIAPAGWDVVTDYATYVYWFSGDETPPYPDDIAAGADLSGFSIYAPGDGSTSEAYSLTGWDHSLNQPGANGNGEIFGPGPPPVDDTPEIGTFSMAFSFLVIASARYIARRHL